MSGEMIKHTGIVGKHWLFRLFKKIWDEKTIPREWREGTIIPLFKKRRSEKIFQLQRDNPDVTGRQTI